MVLALAAASKLHHRATTPMRASIAGIAARRRNPWLIGNAVTACAGLNHNIDDQVAALLCGYQTNPDTHHQGRPAAASTTDTGFQDQMAHHG